MPRARFSSFEPLRRWPRRRVLGALAVGTVGGLTGCGSTQTGELLRPDGSAAPGVDAAGGSAADSAAAGADAATSSAGSDAAPGADVARSPDGQLAATPSCGAGPTRAQTEGPYWKPSSPRRAVLREAGTSGATLIVEGFVVNRACQPIANAFVDLWQCDDKGVYDNTGYKLRGHVLTGADGRYHFETIVPGLYPGRTRHLHVKVRAPQQTQELTTQLYFPGDAENARDAIYNAALVMRVEGSAAEKVGRFDFVLNV